MTIRIFYEAITFSYGWHNLVFPIRKKQDTKFTRKKTSKKFHSHADPLNPPFPCHSERKPAVIPSGSEESEIGNWKFLETFSPSTWTLGL
jgi:hypothetical protein